MAVLSRVETWSSANLANCPLVRCCVTQTSLTTWSRLSTTPCIQHSVQSHVRWSSHKILTNQNSSDLHAIYRLRRAEHNRRFFIPLLGRLSLEGRTRKHLGMWHLDFSALYSSEPTNYRWGYAEYLITKSIESTSFPPLLFVLPRNLFSWHCPRRIQRFATECYLFP